MLPFKSLLVIAPHADDEVLGCGGLIARMHREHLTVHLLVMSPSNEKRREETYKAAEMLGIRSITFGDYPTSNLDTVPMVKLISEIEQKIMVEKPDAVAFPDLGASHQDHRAVSQAAVSATRPSGSTATHRPQIVLTYEEVADAWQPRPMETPSLTVELQKEDIDTKLKAMSAHHSQIRPQPSERSLSAIMSLAVVRGAQAGVHFGESYKVLRWLI